MTQQDQQSFWNKIRLQAKALQSYLRLTLTSSGSPDLWADLSDGHNRVRLPIPLLNPSQPLTLQKEQVGHLSSSQSNLPDSSNKERLYWCSFRDNDNSFVGVAIWRGASPGKAASAALDKLELGYNKASIIIIPESLEAHYEKFSGRLLSEEECRDAFSGLVSKYT